MIRQTARNATAQKNNVRLLAARDIFGVASFAFGGFGLLLFFAALAFLLVEFDGFVGDGLRLCEVGLQPLHLRAALVNFHELLRRQQTETHHAAINQRRAIIAHGRNQVAAAKPRIAKKRTGLKESAAFDLIVRERCKLAGIEIEFARGFGLRPLRRQWRRSASARLARLKVFDDFGKARLRRWRFRTEHFFEP